MDEANALAALAALSQATRLQTFRLLVSREPDGVPAGELARLIGVPQNTLSTHLSILVNAGLAHGERHSRSIIYRADVERLRRLVLFLLKDCCGGQPELCAPLIADLSPCCPPEAPPMTDHVYNVLFLCTGNSARSIIAESILNQDGRGRFRAFSAGSHPKGAVNPFAMKVLESYGYPTEDARSKDWDEFAAPGAPQMDFVFTVCDNSAGEVCPHWPGQPMTAHWGIEDPAGVEGSDLDKERAFVTALRYLKNRIGVFTAIPIDRLDRLKLVSRLKEIGQMEGGTHGRDEIKA